jgi:type II secretory pathway pseudopilin PulG
MKFPHKSSAGLTLIELMTVIVIIMIMAAMILPIANYVRDRTDKASCMNNLKNLAGAAGHYMQDYNRWPQIKVTGGTSKEASKAWVKTLDPYGISHKNWICPTVQRGLKGEDYTKDTTFRVDYWMSHFGPHPRAPYQSMTQPWFVEKQDVHGNGNLLIYPDGTIEELNEIRRESDALY